MNGQPDYNNYDNSGDCSAANLGVGGFSPVGALIHTTSGNNSLHWLLSGAATSGNPATANFLIDRDGTRHKIVPAGRWGYHAGASRLIYNNRLYRGDQISQLLMGVELENQDDTNVTWQQVDSLAELVVLEGLDRGWRWPYYLVGHYEVALPLGRRSDPLGLDWGSLMGRLYARALASKVGGL